METADDARAARPKAGDGRIDDWKIEMERVRPARMSLACKSSNPSGVPGPCKIAVTTALGPCMLGPPKQVKKGHSQIAVTTAFGPYLLGPPIGMFV